MPSRGAIVRATLGAASSAIFLAVVAPAALAQVSPNPTVVPTKNTGGWVYGMAFLIALLGILLVLLVAFGYMRFAPRFQRDEGAPKTVRADRVVPGRELPRRQVDVTQAAPVVVAPPPVAASAPAATPAAAAVGVASAPAPATAVAPAPAATPAAAAAAASAPAPAPAAEQPPAAEQTSPAAVPAERPEVELDQEVFERTLEELLAKGTSRRVAEGQARRAAMIAARKKAEA